MRRFAGILSLIAASTFASTTGTAAQQVPLEEKPLYVAIVDDFPEVDAKVILVRETGRDIVLLRAGDATPENLAFAITTRRRVGDEAMAPGIHEMLPITGGAFPNGFNEERRSLLRAVLDSVETRPTTRIGTFGYGRWMRYQPPSEDDGIG